MIIHLFILSSAVQTYEFSYIHFQSSYWTRKNSDARLLSLRVDIYRGKLLYSYTNCFTCCDNSRSFFFYKHIKFDCCTAFKISTFFEVGHVLIGYGVPWMEVKLGFRTQEKCPFLLNRGVQFNRGNTIQRLYEHFSWLGIAKDILIWIGYR